MKYIVVFIIVSLVLLCTLSNKNDVFSQEALKKVKSMEDIQNFVNLIKYCPICKDSLSDRDTIDMLIQGKVCSSGHKLFIPLAYVSMNEAEGDYLKLHYNSKEEKEVAKAWLSNSQFRKHLADQLAEILRIYLEVESGKFDKTEQKETEFKYCPVCGEKLTEFKQDDAWVIGKKCKNNHTYRERGYRLHYSPTSQLCMDMNYNQLILSTQAWLENQNLKKYLPNQVEELLLYIQRKIK